MEDTLNRALEISYDTIYRDDYIVYTRPDPNPKLSKVIVNQENGYRELKTRMDSEAEVGRSSWKQHD